ncbi:MFS transporter [Brucella thiophenivorans]|uniref:Major Facilitator Superfamily protein n=1 Tax=Brucella thiophenivorans TaxID=571255 RepID=A0A256FEY3_9HYPH|nr:MFS transporter [Brucella thiophenivorans]OYR13432.1 major Facilitator Superfamily protein [Brucella thiophenivorans]
MSTSSLDLVRQYPIVRASTIAILFFGFAGAATTPYQPIVGIKVIGLSDFTYSVVAFCAVVANLAASIAIGLVSDRIGRYRAPMIIVTALGVVGFGLIWLFPTPWVFALATIGPIALFNVVSTLLFANIRNHSAGMTPIELGDSITIVRMAISIAWILVPGLVGAALAGTGSALTAYSFATLLALGCFASIATLMPHDHHKNLEKSHKKASSFDGFKRLFSPFVVTRLLGIALITSVLHVNAIALPLIITGRGGGSVEDVGMVMGFVAGLEAILMLVWARIGRRRSQIGIFFVASLLYAIYLIWLAFLTTRWEIYAASTIGGIGAAAIVSQPISYLLGIIHDRPGLSASLIAINMFVGGGIGTALFAIGTSFAGYGTVTIMGAIAGLAGVAILAKAEYKKN